MGVSSWICFLPITLSIRYFVEAGRTSPATRLIAISTKPKASSPRLGFISPQTSGRLFHAFLRFSLLTGVGDAIAVVAMIWMKRTLRVRCGSRLYHYIAKTPWKVGIVLALALS